jgi:hypothetical protein
MYMRTVRKDSKTIAENYSVTQWHLVGCRHGVIYLKVRSDFGVGGDGESNRDGKIKWRMF